MMSGRATKWAKRLAVAVVLTAAAPVLATGGVYVQTAHGHPASGVQRLPGEPVGDCAHCHDLHASRDGMMTGGPFPFALFATNDNQLCGSAVGCHATASGLGIYQGLNAYEGSAHAGSSAMVWPGPDPRSRPTSDAGLCVNCHTPHGSADGLGLVASLGTRREELSCNACHDASGPAMTDIQADVTKASRHPVGDHAGRHLAAEEGDASAYGQLNRHAECEDCHNPHEARADSLPPAAPEASQRLRGVSRVAVTNGPAGTLPTYTFRAAGDPAPIQEFEVCFKCHSSWTTQPAGQEDLAVSLNPNNPSYHPVEAVGKNNGIDPAAFVGGWDDLDQTYCSECHRSDDNRFAGPHGSIYPRLLAAGYSDSSGFRPMGPTELCFNCHSYAVYANNSSPDAVQSASRFNQPMVMGHAGHVGEKQVPCYACHESHGSTTQPFLIAVGRTPGVISFQSSPTGGTCTATCHGPESYGLNYPR
jgi:hypothetical protein